MLQKRRNHFLLQALVTFLIVLSASALPTEIEPRLRTTLSLPGSARDIAIVGDHAYIASDQAGLQVLNISDPTQPRIVGFLDTPGSATAIAISENLALIADGAAGLQVIDITYATNPRSLGTYDSPGAAMDVVVVGNAAYLADGRSGIQVIDLTDPANPQRQTNIPILTTHLAVSGSLLARIQEFLPGDPYGAYAGSPSIDLFDVQQAFQPRFLSTLSRPSGVTGLDCFTRVAFNGGILYATFERYRQCCEGLAFYDTTVAVAIDVSDPTLPREVSTIGTGARGQAFAAGDYLLLGGDRFHQLVQVVSSSRLALRATITTPQNTTCAAFVGDHLFILGSELSVFDLTRQANPRASSITGTGGSAINLTVRDGVAFVADFVRGLNIFDVATPGAPRVIFNSDTAPAYDVAVFGNSVYVAGGLPGFRMFDLENPATPVSFGANAAYKLAVIGPRLCVQDNARIYIYDITNPASPVLWATLGESPETPTRIVPYSDDLLAMSYRGRLRIYDLSGAYPQLRRTVDEREYSQTLVVHGQYAYAHYDYFRLDILDINTPEGRIVGSLQLGVYMRNIAIHGNYAYISTWSSILVCDIRDPANPRLVSRNQGLNARSIVVNQGRLYVAAGIDGLAILEPYPQIRFQSLSASPFTFMLDGPDGISGELDRSTDFTDWSPLQPITFSQDPIQIIDAPAQTSFYRFRVP